MITLAEQLLEEKVLKNLKNHSCPSHMYGQAGNYLQNQVENILGITISDGLIDIVSHGISLELKSRREGVDSAFTIGSIHESNIINTLDWTNSPICTKMRKILLITTGGTERDKDDNVVKDVKIYDFYSKPEIQDMLEQSYRHSRNQIVANVNSNPQLVYCEYTGYLAYFERVKVNENYTNSWKFRFAKQKFQDLLTMGNSNFNNVIEYNV